MIVAAVNESDKVNFFVILSGPVLSLAQDNKYSAVTNDGESVTTYDAEQLNQTLREMKSSGVDPIPVLAELTQTGLWLWGSMDKSVPVIVSAENLQVLIESGKQNFSYFILANGDHNLNISMHGYFERSHMRGGEKRKKRAAAPPAGIHGLSCRPLWHMGFCLSVRSSLLQQVSSLCL